MFLQTFLISSMFVINFHNTKNTIRTPNLIIDDRCAGSLLIGVLDIVARIGHSETPPFRPRLPTDGKSVDVERYIKLMRDCWADNPQDRLDIAGVKRVFATFHNNKSVNVFSIAVQRRTFG